jgi:hypothetical protein
MSVLNFGRFVVVYTCLHKCVYVFLPLEAVMYMYMQGTVSCILACRKLSHVYLRLPLQLLHVRYVGLF